MNFYLVHVYRKSKWLALSTPRADEEMEDKIKALYENLNEKCSDSAFTAFYEKCDRAAAVLSGIHSFIPLGIKSHEAKIYRIFTIKAMAKMYN